MKPVISIITAVCLSSMCMSQPAVNLEAHEISLPDAKGTLVNLSSLKGKVVLIDFWASWCKPCRESMPHLLALNKKYKSKGFAIYSVSFDTDKDEWKRAIFEDDTKWTHVIDIDGTTALDWNINYIPSTFLLDKTGKIIAADVSPKELEAMIKRLLEQNQ